MQALPVIAPVWKLNAQNPISSDRDAPSVKAVVTVVSTLLSPRDLVKVPKRSPYVFRSGTTVDKLYDAGFGFLKKKFQHIEMVDLSKAIADILDDFRS